MTSFVGGLTGQIQVELCNKDTKESRVETVLFLICGFNMYSRTQHAPNISFWCYSVFPREINSAVWSPKCPRCVCVVALLVSGNSGQLCWILAPQISDVFPWVAEHLLGPTQKVFSCCDFVRDFIRQEIKSHREKGKVDEPEDFIDFYLDQMEKVSDLCDTDPVLTDSLHLSYSSLYKAKFLQSSINTV